MSIVIYILLWCLVLFYFEKVFKKRLMNLSRSLQDALALEVLIYIYYKDGLQSALLIGIVTFTSYLFQMSLLNFYGVSKYHLLLSLRLYILGVKQVLRLPQFSVGTLVKLTLIGVISC